MTVRPLTEEDVEAAAAVAARALPIPAEFDDGTRPAWLALRISRLRASDPGGAWVSEQNGRITGVALALVRDGVWGLSLLGVDPDLHGRGAGRALLTASLQHAEGARGAIIASSQDPRAMRLYALAGFDLRPCVALAGALAPADPSPAAERLVSEDVEQAAALAVPARGAAYGPEDLRTYLDRGDELLLEPGRGFAIHTDGSPLVLAAKDDDAAAGLLRACFARAPRGGSVHVDLITAGQDWAIRVGLEAGLALSPDGPLYTRGELGPLRPWLPSGSFL